MGSPAWHERQGTYLADLAAAGVTPEEIDVVVCTHLHPDHVGWNTRLDRGRWVPTFPRAQYVFAGEEWEFWKHEHETGAEEYGCIADSVLPVVAAGRAVLVDGDHVIDGFLRLERAPGHTPGHVWVRLRTGGGEAVFSGDLIHRTVQVAEPQWSSRFCTEPARARVTRREFLERRADSGILVIPAHFPHPGHVVPEAGGLRFVAAPFARV